MNATQNNAAASFAAALAAGHDLYWWHRALLLELERIGQCEDWPHGPAATVAGLAMNVRGMTSLDAGHYVDQLIAAGLVRDIEPLWDYPGARFVALTA